MKRQLFSLLSASALVLSASLVVPLSNSIVPVQPIYAQTETSPEESTTTTVVNGEETTEEALDYDVLRQGLIEATPMTQEQLDQLTDEDLKAVTEDIQATVPTGGDIGTVYDWLLKAKSEVFSPEVTRIQEALIDGQGLVAEEVQEIESSTLLWKEYMIFEENHREDIKALADELVAQGLASREETEIDDIRSVLLSDTPITQAQLDQIDDQILIDLSEEVNQNGGDPATVFDRLLETYPKVFEDEIERIQTELIDHHDLDEESLKNLESSILLWREFEVYEENDKEDFETLADLLVKEEGVKLAEEDKPTDDSAAIRKELINGTPITQGQLDQFSDEQLDNAIKDIMENSEGGDPSALFNKLLADYPEVFQAEVDRITNELVNKHGLNADELAELGSQILLWEEFMIFSDHNNQENFSALADRLVSEYQLTRKQPDKVIVETTTSRVDAETKHPTAILPDTGEENTGFLVIVSMVVGAIGFVLLRKKHRTVK
ncbi:LPXTG cell wall anchor domain-containing protein [Facklamia lactis]|uniref:LPXTG cell wall anchor domain-containing protein n=1 Tax=Facklamia lactis TaxID=2749967 RepID=UPI0018CEFC83|nr:LPXTG cell wall anchor domain-containing protein [Facklamia lactis]MBG9980337.1 LPXTG cell wall anchor domain-containing protein [Facklamia lactis]